MPLGYLGTVIGSSIILNQPEHQDQPGMETAVDCDDSHHLSCWKDWQASFHRFTRQDTSLCLGCNPPSPLWVLKAWQVNSASCHPPFYPTPQPLADAPYKGQLAGVMKRRQLWTREHRYQRFSLHGGLSHVFEVSCMITGRCAICNMAELQRKDWQPTKHCSNKHSDERKVFCDLKDLQVNPPWDEFSSYSFPHRRPIWDE